MVMTANAWGMEIYIHLLNGMWPTNISSTNFNAAGDLILEMEPSDSFEYVKSKIQVKTGFNPSGMKLSYGTYEDLADNQILYECGITQNGTTINLTTIPYRTDSDHNSWAFQMPLGNYALRTTWKQECGLMFLDENEEAITGNVNAYVGFPFTAPMLNNLDLTVTYTSSNTDVATVDENGVVTILATGTTTITAAFAGNDDIQPCEASYTLVVSEPYTLTLNTNDPAMGTVTLTEVAKSYEAFKTNVLNKTTYEGTFVTVEGSSVDNNGLKVSTVNSVTISSSQKTIAKVDLHAGGGWGYVANLTTTKGTVDWNSNFQSGSITGVNAKSLTIGMQQQSMYIDSITVYYMPDSVAPYMNGTTVVADKYRIVPGKNVTVKATAASATHYIAEWTKQQGTAAAVTLGTDIAETASTTFPMEASTVIAGTFAVRPVLKLATNDPAMGTVKIDSAGGSGEKTIYTNISVSVCCTSEPDEGCEKLFDGDTSGHNKWGTEDQNKFVEFQTSAAVQVNGYTLVTGDDNADYWGQGRNPKSWVLKAKLASTDSWTTVATVNNDETMQDVNYTPFDFEMVPGTYQYFRFEVSALRGDGNFMQLGEMQLFKKRAISFLDSVSVKDAAANEYYVLPGAKVAVKAIPAAGYQLLKWEDNSTDLDRTVTVTGDTTVLATFGLPTPGVTPEGNLTVFGGRFLSETGEIVATPALTETGELIDESVVPVPVPVIDGVDLSTLTDNYVAQDGDTLTGTLNANVKISIAAGATVTLAGVTINGTNSNAYKWAGITCEGNATIILMDGTTDTVKGFYNEFPGIYVPEGFTLTIQGGTSGTGALIASSNGNGAGIGGGWNISCGNINIQGGNITANGGFALAGIGGGRGGSCGTISITGGNVKAYGGNEAAGIGGSRAGSCGTIEISGGTVLSNGGKYGAGIGSGYAEFGPASCGNIHISGGTITATGGEEAAGIGGGKKTTNYVTQCGTITITAGVISVTATKGQGAPNSIGAGAGGTCGTVTIEPGANVTQN